MKEMTARAAVTERFPVAVTPKGVRPIRFMKRMKKKIVRMNGVYRSAP